MNPVLSEGMLVLTDYDEVSAVLRAPGWSSDPRLHHGAPPETQHIPPTFLLFHQPDLHKRIRELLDPAFTRRAVEQARPRVAAIVDAALSGLEESGLADDADLVRDFSEVIPLAVLAELLDVGAEEAEAIRTHTAALIKILQVDSTATDFASSIDAAFELATVFTPLIVDRQEHPGNDFISALLSHGEVSVDEALSLIMILLAAGFETPADTISNGALALMQQPDQRAHLFANPGRAVEELLRITGSIRLLKRTALVDQRIGARRIPAGTTVVLDLHRANTDPHRFPDADRLDLSRQPRAHVGLGKGAHICLGAALGRIQTAEALTRLFRTFPDIHPVTDPQWRDMKEIHGLHRLPVRLTGARR